MNLQFPKLLRPFIGKYTWRKLSSSKTIYITFDDGPVPEVTPFILKLLDEYGIKATFFCVGENVKKYPELYQEVLSRGHRVGNHTYNHLKGYSVSKEEYLNNVEKAARLIDSNLFRPPYGKMKRSQQKALNEKYELILWDVITYDYNTKLSPQKVFNNVKHYTRNGSIILFHDSIKAKNNVLAVLPLAIEFWNKKGYNFGVI